MVGAALPDAPMERIPTPPPASTSESEPMEGPSTPASELNFPVFATPQMWGSLPPSDPPTPTGSDSPSSSRSAWPPGMTSSGITLEETAGSEAATAIDVSAAWAELENQAGRDAAVLEGWLSELGSRLEEDLAAERKRAVASKAATQAHHVEAAPRAHSRGEAEVQRVRPELRELAAQLDPRRDSEVPSSASTSLGHARARTFARDASTASSEPDASPAWDVENPPAACREEVALRDASKTQSEDERDASKASSTPDTACGQSWRWISARRRMTMKQHHGKTSLHKAAWYAECITCGAFSVACLIMLCLWARHVNEESFVNTFFVTAIAALTYFAKSCHMGDAIIMGNLVPVVRYIDWITTTPLMLYELCHIAHATTPMLTMVVMSDLLMLATGIIAALIPWKTHRGLKQVWFGAASSFYILLVVVLHVDVGYKASKQIEVAANLFKQLEVLIIVIWSFYPIIVSIGRAHLGLITKPTEDICLCILDVVSKIGMEGLIVASCFNGCTEEG